MNAKNNKKEVGTSNLSRNLDEKTYDHDTYLKHLGQLLTEDYIELIRYSVKMIMDMSPGHSNALQTIKQATEQGIMWHVDELNKNNKEKQ